ncbi:MAG: S8 family serine peptidase [Bacteroidia bacterium]|nr:S8 family serine peptidase [Bacteroidia bacterium]
MKRISFIILMMFIVNLFASGQGEQPSCRLILKFKNNIFCNNLNYSRNATGNLNVDSVSQKFNAIKTEVFRFGKNGIHCFYVLTFPYGSNILGIREAYYKTGEIEYAESDPIGSGGGIQTNSPNDQFYGRQWGLKNDGTFSLSASKAGADIEMENAWSIEQGDSEIVVAIIDSGTKLDHPEFSGRIWANNNEITNNGIDDDNNGYIDDTRGWDFVNDDNNPTDDHGHGTMVAGIIGSNGNNSIGYTGIDWNCKLMTLKALSSSNYGLYSWWAAAIYYAVDNGAKVINLSLGGTTPSFTLDNAVGYALNHNVVVVASMMNNNTNVVSYPAGCNGVIAVGATNSDDQRSKAFLGDITSGSNYGTHISVVAPGNYIYGLNHLSNTNYNSYWGGTSFSAPLVSGLASLLLAQNRGRTASQIKLILESSSEDQVGDTSEDKPGFDSFYGHGRINAYSALTIPAPVQPLISGDTFPCIGSSYSYTAYSSNATTYYWTAPGWIIDSGQWTSTIYLTADLNNEAVCATPYNIYGPGKKACLKVTLSQKPGPAYIYGPSTVQENTSVKFTTTAFNSFKTSYNWAVPLGWIINSGQGTDTIIVTVDSSSGLVCATPFTTCGIGLRGCDSVTITTNTGISSSLYNKPLLYLFPNPTEGTVSIKFGSIIKEPTTISLFNELGQMLLEKEIMKDLQEIDLRGFPAGMYLFIFNSKDWHQTYKLQKQ